MGAVSADIEDEVESRLRRSAGEIGGEGDPGRAASRSPPEGLAALQIVVNRPLARERPVAIGIRKDDPAVAGPGDHEDETVSYRAVAVQIRGRWRAERDLADQAGVVGTLG